MADEEVKDPQALLKSYREAVEDLKALREENKELKEAGSDEVINKWKTRAARSEAKLALQGQGIKDSERILKYLSLEGVDFDDDDKVTGLDEKLEEVKKDFPELFDAKKRAGRSSVDIHADNPANTKKSTTEEQVDAIFG